MTADRRFRVLVAIPSTNQMYSGVGRAIRELCARMSRRVAFDFAIDDANQRNLNLLRDFAREHRMTVHVGRHRYDDRFVDPVNQDLPDRLARGGHDAVELIGFANAATGTAVLDALGPATLAYTPHDQPLWTVPMSELQGAIAADVHRRVIERADLVLADSPHERRSLQALCPARSHVEFHPLGCDFSAFLPGPLHRPERLLFIGDLNEARKRFDRVAAVFERLLSRRPQPRLTVVGNRSDDLASLLDPSIRHAVELRGYVAESQLLALHRESRALLLFSDVEAFGLPILEALASGTPVYLSDLPTTRGLFAPYRSARFCRPDDTDETARIVADGLERGEASIAEALAERPALESRFDWNQLADAKAQALIAAWWRRNRWPLAA